MALSLHCNNRPSAGMDKTYRFQPASRCRGERIATATAFEEIRQSNGVRCWRLKKILQMRASTSASAGRLDG
jgi:hypothetical protein